jgi:peptidylprolyl isomerase
MKTKIVILSLTAAFFMNCNAQPTKSSFDPSLLGDSPELTLETSMGRITVKLYAETPLHRDNFLKLASTGFYDSTLFHRVIQNFMIQAGDPDSKNPQEGKMYGSGGPDYTIPAEIVPGLYHKKGALAAARQGDQVNPEKRSSGSQFYIVQGQVTPPEQIDQLIEQKHQSKLQEAFMAFIYLPENQKYLMALQEAQTKQDQAAYMEVINTIQPELEQRIGSDESWKLTPEQITAYTTVGGTPHLDGGYTVFGEVLEGFDVIDKIAAVQKDGNDRPVENVFILRIAPRGK